MNNGRALIVLFGLVIFFAILVTALINLQVGKHEKYKFLADRQQNSGSQIIAQRGFIKDRNGKVLAFTNNDISFFVDTRMLKKGETEKIAEKFSEVFGKSKTYYKNLINSSKKNICIEKKAPMEKALMISDFTIDALYKTEDYSRVYPYGSLASHIVGYVDLKTNGIAGIEKQMNENLTGENGYRYIEQDVLGRMVSVNEELSKTPVPGNDILLTINKDYQKVLEDELQNGVKSFQGNSGVGIVMDPNNGEILAMASFPSYDPANYNVFPDTTLRNRVLTDTYEPGSTIKSIIMSMLLEENLVSENEIINTENGRYKIKGARISDSHKYEQLTVREVLEHSSNIGMVKLSDRINPNTFYKYLRDFGFGNTTSIDLPGETEGTLKKPANFSGISKAFISQGYEISITPIQLLAAYGALVNGGYLYQPFVVKEIKDFHGNTIEKSEPKKIRKIINNETSNKIKEFMIGVVESGTGKAAQLKDLLVGGKTGTAQKLINGRYSSRHHNSSFIGFFPADNPKIVCLILVDSPQIGRYGGQVAAPIFKAVAQRIVEADVTIAPNKIRIDRKEDLIEEMFADINSEGIAPEILNTSNIGEETTVNRIKEDYSNRTTMPDLKNQSLRSAVTSLTQLGLKYKVIGTGKVVEQSINPGDKINPGDVVLITCRATEKLKGLKIN
ncbi:MAG: transpeptidase family protein [Bacteroidetes bacterium]|nr:transpeptidase family protein [Bacteroidota bacterium]